MSWKPLLIPNDKGKEVNWHERIVDPNKWLILTKRDGVRIEIGEDFVKGRSLKPVFSKQILKMATGLQSWIKDKGIILEEKERYKDALAAFNKVLQLDPDDKRALKHKNCLMNQLKDSD